MFLLSVFLAVQVTLHLSATTQAGALALEAASRVARAEPSCPQAEAWVAGRIPGWDGVAAPLPRRRRSRPRHPAGAEVVVVGSLVFVVGLLLLVNAWNVVDARFTSDATAPEATRAFVEADPGHAQAAAHDAAAAAMGAMGRPGAPALQVDGDCAGVRGSRSRPR